MTSEQILRTISNADCKEQLRTHIVDIERAINQGLCDFDGAAWEVIYRTAQAKMNDFENRVIH